MMKNKSLLITAPSGAGKTTLVKRLLSEFDFLEFSISATTRDKRGEEVDGVDYHFISIKEFQKRVVNNEFVEHEEVYPGSHYGTLKSEIDKIHSHSSIPIFDIDIMGAMSVEKSLGKNVLSFFIAPPNMEVLENRLRDRKTDSDEKIKMRIDKAHSEMKFQNFFDTKIVNDDLDRAYAELRAKVIAFLGL